MVQVVVDISPIRDQEKHIYWQSTGTSNLGASSTHWIPVTRWFPLTTVLGENWKYENSDSHFRDKEIEIAY